MSKAPSRHRAHILPSLLAGALCLGFTVEAAASGFAVARFGGTHGNPTEANPTAIYYNPGGLGLIDRTQIMLDVNWAYRTASYERSPNAVGRPSDTPGNNADAIAANTGEGTLSNLVYSPMVGVATDFHLDLPFAVGLGFYAPFGGSAEWDRNDGVAGYPGSADGAQRWYTIDGTQRTLAISLGAAYVIESARVSIGAAGNLYMSEINTVRARTASGFDTLESGGFVVEGRSQVEGSSTDFGLGVGVLWETLPDRLWIGASYQSRPNFHGRMTLEGTLRNYFPPNRDENEVVITQTLPDIIRLGARFRPIPKVELRLFGDLTMWSAFEHQCIIESSRLDGADPHEFCRTDPDGNGRLANPDNNVVLNLERRWNNAAGIRLGGSYFLSDRVELFGDVGFDGNAVPDETLEPALFDMNKVSAGVGGQFRLHRNVSIALSGTNIFYMERDTNGVPTANNYAVGSPSIQPSSEGVYRQNIFVVNTGLYFNL